MYSMYVYVCVDHEFGKWSLISSLYNFDDNPIKINMLHR